MGKTNKFSRKFSEKSDFELQSILSSEDHVYKAEQAASWELERRNVTPEINLTNQKQSLYVKNIECLILKRKR